MSIAQAIPRPGARRSRPFAAADAKLVGRVRAGDERAFEAIFKRHHAPLLSYARHMLANQDEAEDALQQAFIKAHRALLGGTVPRELRPWLYAIVRNCCLSAIAARRHTVELDEHTANLAGLPEVVHEREDLRELLADIGRLPEDQRSALLLAELDDLSHQSIATIVGCPVSKVKALVYQARSTLIADRDARSASCHDIREELAVARGGELRRGPLRRHLSLCVGCRDFQRALGAQRRSLAVALPVLPSAGLAAKILSHSALQAAGAAGQAGAAAAPAGAAVAPAAATAAPAAVAGGGASVGTAASAAATGASAAAGSGGTGAVVGSGVLAKVAVGGAVAVLATAGAVTTAHHQARPHRRHLAYAQVDRAHRSHRTPSVRPQTQPSVASGTLSADVSAAAVGTTASAPEPAAIATTDTVLSSPLSQSTPQIPQAPTLTSAGLSPPATSAATAPTATQAPGGQATEPQSGSSGSTAPVIRHHRRLERQRRGLQRLRRLRQAEHRRLQAERRQLAREERRRKAQELKEARERRERLREERQRKAQELKEARERRERLLREERQRKAQELKEAKERRELEAQRKREQREAAAAAPQSSTQTTQSTTPVTTTTPSTEASSTASTEATSTGSKRKRKKS
jgi:RNA polymerase sigma factor (sigma-70 family)